MKMRFLILCLIAIAQLQASDSLNFVSPVDHKIVLSGNFMELRTNHFHAGIDIKSKRGVAGDVIRSVQDGYVSRIRITSGSYGNALYIDHPNGLTSVYAHLDNFIPEINSYLESIQYEMQSFEVDIYLPDSLLNLDQGQEIGKMGNTGRSFGPHLHFELRETKTERPVNPELYGLTTGDDIAPTIQALHVYNIGNDGRILETESKYFNKKKKGYVLYNDVIDVSSTKIGFGLQMFDRMNASYNKNGVYAYELYVGDQLHFAWKANAFSFSDSRKINGFIDFNKNQRNSQKVYLLYKQSCNNFPGYEGESDGIVDLDSLSGRPIKIIAKDIKGNASTIEFKLQKKEQRQRTITPAQFSCDTSTVHQEGEFSIEMDAGSFFTPQSFQIKSLNKDILNQKCSGISIGDKSIPVSKYIRISCPIPNNYDSKWTFVSTDSKGRYIHFGADTLDGQIFTYIDQLGEFFLFRDAVPPKMEVVNLEPTMKAPWKVKIYDNLIPDGRVDDLSYEAYINGEWINMTYDLKNKLLIFKDFDRIPPKPFEFKLFLSDSNGNAKVYSKTFK